MEHLSAVQARIAGIESMVQRLHGRAAVPVPAAAPSSARPAAAATASFQTLLGEAMSPARPGASGLRNPVDARVSSAFGTRTHPISGERHHHAGVDFAAPAGTPVLAAADGVVEFAGQRGGYGNLVVLRHPDGTETRYAHQRDLAVRAGDRVEAGAPLGTVGSTGRSTGPHLHFELRRDGVPVDPLPLLP